jgi:hypothetical protein
LRRFGAGKGRLGVHRRQWHWEVRPLLDNLRMTG